jgi:hypothetical protein
MVNTTSYWVAGVLGVNFSDWLIESSETESTLFRSRFCWGLKKNNMLFVKQKGPENK